MHTDEDAIFQQKSYLKAKMIAWYLEKRLLPDVAFLEHFGYQGHVVYEDGIIHNNSRALSKYELFEKVYDENSTTYKKNSKPEAIIFCKISPDECAQRRLKRVNEGKGTFVDKSLSVNEMYSVCIDEYEIVGKLADNFKAINTPVFTVNMEEGLERQEVTVNQLLLILS
ncbi:hypothetical protein [Rhodohalobacter sp.]|uniref:hypothetical protein n=1 Tax=Rhodohalobacter sp. TaxID=1974210 RepID=UPI002ACE6754|nr:hypothetical protein [Rhodohalobacter sp.]MDZ7755173.1 hypothetical protein [Rhodohalobacter sp.]